ncbi:DUF6862 domain-containing protein [Denitromonas sp.]|uniref:DUF6862 domain-containing protein n=1 Tax=Denitromonas sp. TaxID=2734609 RepID=UPI002AFE1B25|nr:DUF637 domain-containing protein [Denitromonas sp.]
MLWYVNQGGSLTPTVYLPASWQQQLIDLPGDALRNSLVNDMAAFGANDIGDGNFGEQGSVGRTLAHGVLGAMAESARGGDPLAGAIGAMTAAQLSKPLGDSLGVSQGDTGTQAAVTALTMLAGGLLAEAAGRDAEAGGAAAQNEVINNYLDHLESTEYAALEERCGRAGSGCTAQEQARMRELNTLDKARDALLASACANPSSVACAGQLADLNAARTSFSGQDVAAGSRAASELAWIKQEQAKLEARVQNPGTYNVGTAVLEVAGGTVKGTLDLAALSAQAASGDTTAQAQLSQIAEAIGEFFASPVDTIEQHISTTLAEARTLDDAGRTDEAQRLRATLFTEGALAVTGAGALVVKGSGKIVATAERVFSDQAERIATRALLESGGMIDTATGQALLDLKQLSNPQKAVMGELFGEHTVRQIIPDGEKLARMPGPGETGIDDLYKVNRPDVDYVVIEYKFVGSNTGKGSWRLDKTPADGPQGSESWTLGSGRVEKAVGEHHAPDVRRAIDSGRVETWVISTRPDGSTILEVLDALGKPKPVEASKLLPFTANLAGAQP